MKILLIRNDNIGDLICSTPSIQALRKANPNAQIDIVLNSLNAPVMHQNPYVNNVLVYTKTKHVKGVFNKLKALWDKTKLLIKVYRTGYDAAVILRSSFSRHAGLWAKAARAKICIGIEPSPAPVNKQIRLEKNMHESEICYKLLALLGAKNSGESPLLIPQKVNDKFGGYVFFHVSSRIKNASLSLEKTSQIAKAIASEFKLVITAENMEFGNAVAKEAGVEFLPTNGLFELVGYLPKAKALITLDGGLMHAGSAINEASLPMVAILGPTNQARWKPLGKNIMLLQPDSHIADDVKAEEVLSVARELFK